MSTRDPRAFDVRLGATLRLLRVERGMTLATLASGLGISYQQVRKYEVGSSRLSVYRLVQICECLSVPVTAFFDEGLEVEACDIAGSV